MNVVSNAGPLINLAKLGILHLLPQLYDNVLIPAAVYEEVVVRGKETNQPDAYVVELAIARSDIQVVSQQTIPFPDIDVLPIDRGEKQAIALARSASTNVVLLDDLLAREAAQQLGLRVKGTLGVIVAAYRQKRLTRDELDIVCGAMMARQDIWISDALIRRVWQELIQSTPE